MAAAQPAGPAPTTITSASTMASRRLHDPRLSELGTRRLVEAEIREDLLVVLSETGRAGPNARRRPREVRGRPDDRGGRTVFQRHRLQHVALEHVGVTRRLAVGVDRRDADARTIQDLD